MSVAKHLYMESEAKDSSDVDRQAREALKLPVVVKPNNEGSSVGVTIVYTYDDLEGAIQAAKEFGGHYLMRPLQKSSRLKNPNLKACLFQ